MRSTRIILAMLLAACGGDVAACSISVVGAAFGPINPLHDQAATSVGNVTVNCEVDTPYDVALSTGAAGHWARHMTSGEHTLSYNLYRDALHTEVWGDGSGGTFTVAALAAGQPATHYVYGRVPAQPLARAGTYSDVVVVTVTF